MAAAGPGHHRLQESAVAGVRAAVVVIAGVAAPFSLKVGPASRFCGGGSHQIPQLWPSLRERCCQPSHLSRPWPWLLPRATPSRSHDCPWQWPPPRCTVIVIVTTTGSVRSHRHGVASTGRRPRRLWPSRSRGCHHGSCRGRGLCEATVPRAAHHRHLSSILPRSAEPPARSSFVRPPASACGRSSSPTLPPQKRAVQGEGCASRRPGERLRTPSRSESVGSHESAPRTRRLADAALAEAERIPRRQPVVKESLTAGVRPLEGRVPPHSGRPFLGRCPTSSPEDVRQRALRQRQRQTASKSGCWLDAIIVAW